MMDDLIMAGGFIVGIAALGLAMDWLTVLKKRRNNG